MMLASASFAANDISTKVAVKFLPVPEIMAIRGAFAALLAFAFVVMVHGAAMLRTIANRHVFQRSLFEALIGPILITSYAFLPIATVTAVMQVGPFFGMIAGIWLFKESVGWRRWCAALVAFFGVMLIIKPGTAGFEPIVLIVLLVSIMTVMRDIQSRKIGSAAPPFVVSLATSITGTVLAFILAPLMLPTGLQAWGAWVWPDAFPLAVCLGASVFLVTAHTFAFLAFRSGDMSAVAPFRYFYLLVAVVGGIVVFSEYPDWISLIGMALVVGGGLYLLHRERLRSKNAVAAESAPAGG
jgi:drug/metabolite transporter (DMT)-like permease